MKNFKPGEVAFDLRATFSSRLKDAVGSDIFRHTYVKAVMGGEPIDVCENGLYSCHVFVSNFLKMHDLVEIPCANVDSLEKELLKAGWQVYWDRKINEKQVILRPLSVLIWGPRLGSDGLIHKHSGFFLGGQSCVSNDPRSAKDGSTRTIILHNVDLRDVLSEPRQLEKAYIHPKLEG